MFYSMRLNVQKEKNIFVSNGIAIENTMQRTLIGAIPQ